MRCHAKQDKKSKRRRVRDTSDDSWEPHDVSTMICYWRGISLSELMSRIEMAQQVAIEDLFKYSSVDGDNEWMENGLSPSGFDGARCVQHDQRVGRCRHEGVV